MVPAKSRFRKLDGLVPTHALVPSCPVPSKKQSERTLLSVPKREIRAWSQRTCQVPHILILRCGIIRCTSSLQAWPSIKPRRRRNRTAVGSSGVQRTKRLHGPARPQIPVKPSKTINREINHRKEMTNLNSPKCRLITLSPLQFNERKKNAPGSRRRFTFSQQIGTNLTQMK